VSANSIFQQAWWLDALAPGQWQEAVVLRGDQLAARLPYVIKQRRGLTLLTSPPLTQTLGPWLRPSTAKYTNKLAEEKELMEELIAQLPKYDLFRQNFSPHITNWLPFYWAGFEQTTRYTYRIEDLTDIDFVWKDFRENIRREIRKAQKQIKVRDDLGIAHFLEINKLTFQRQGLKQPYSDELVQRLDEACAARQCRRMFFAVDAQDKIHAASYIIWDEKTAYYLMGGGDPELRSSGASSLLMWEAIQFASGVTQVFDFEGSMIEPIEKFVRSFGARQTPYFHITKMGRRMRALSGAQQIYATLRGR
jgi:lipid II:glycine glycyltransferase (peptidoglycan interpeptide bridge formation enzyme)